MLRASGFTLAAAVAFVAVELHFAGGEVEGDRLLSTGGLTKKAGLIVLAEAGEIKGWA